MSDSSAGDSLSQAQLEKQLQSEGYESVKKTAEDVIKLCRLCPLLKSEFHPRKSPILSSDKQELCLKGLWIIRKDDVELKLSVVFPARYPNRSPIVLAKAHKMPPNMSLSSLGFCQDGALDFVPGSSIFDVLKVSSKPQVSYDMSP